MKAGTWSILRVGALSFVTSDIVIDESGDIFINERLESGDMVIDESGDMAIDESGDSHY